MQHICPILRLASLHANLLSRMWGIGMPRLLHRFRRSSCQMRGSSLILLSGSAGMMAPLIHVAASVTPIGLSRSIVARKIRQTAYRAVKPQLSPLVWRKNNGGLSRECAREAPWGSSEEGPHTSWGISIKWVCGVKAKCEREIAQVNRESLGQEGECRGSPALYEPERALRIVLCTVMQASAPVLSVTTSNGR